VQAAFCGSKSATDISTNSARGRRSTCEARKVVQDCGREEGSEDAKCLWAMHDMLFEERGRATRYTSLGLRRAVELGAGIRGWRRLDVAAGKACRVRGAGSQLALDAEDDEDDDAADDTAADEHEEYPAR
jgi:hypothetical protein